MKVSFCGDLHGKFNALDKLYELEQPDVIVQCGDFGIWTDNNHKVRKKSPIPVYFCRGNHENHDLLDRATGTTGVHHLKSEYFNRADNIYVCNTGSSINLYEGNTTMFIGGALSIDKCSRVLGVSYWEQELLTKSQEDLVIVEIERSKPNIIVTHTCPSSFIRQHIDFEQRLKFHDPVSKFLDHVFSIHQPEYWFFGHFHDKYVFSEEGTTFIGLDMCDYLTGEITDSFYHSLEV